MAEALDDMGCIGIVNRFDSSLNQVNNHHPKISAVSISLNHDEKEIEILAERGYIICIDTANANNKTVLNKCESTQAGSDDRE